jgi:gamma-glutamyl-gamma-aminobutyrate hydrolase PuuD
MKKTFYIPTGDWPLNLQEYILFFEYLGYQYTTSDADFLILPGGADLGDRPLRDCDEKKSLKDYVSLKRPIVGICRGMQLVISESGGKLIKHIPDEHNQIIHTTINGHWTGQSAWHLTNLGFSVNSRHHQGFSELPPDWEKLDYTYDGIIEAASKDNIFLVQWHPEKREIRNSKAIEWYSENLRKYLFS